MTVLCKDGKTCTADKDQIAAMEAAGWARPGPVVATAPEEATDEGAGEDVKKAPAAKAGKGK